LDVTVTPSGPCFVAGRTPLRRGRPVRAAPGEPATWEHDDPLPTGDYYSLCRCGASRRKPFCDGSHNGVREDDAAGATAAGPGDPLVDPGLAPAASGDLPPGITVTDDGPLRVSGDVRLARADGSPLPAGDPVLLCRCGGSARQPFCDGSHAARGFRDAAAAPER
jgi:CDGSH-type Zn-finger protein